MSFTYLRGFFDKLGPAEGLPPIFLRRRASQTKVHIIGHFFLYDEGTITGKDVSGMYELEFVRGHVEVYLDGEFCFSADTRGEAEAEIALLTA